MQEDFQRPFVPTSSHLDHNNTSSSVGYGTITNMPDCQNHGQLQNNALDKGEISCSIDTRSAFKMPSEFESSTQRQRRMKSIRLYAILLCTTISIGSILVYRVKGSADIELAKLSMSRSSLVDRSIQSFGKASKMSKVEQPTKRLEEDPDHKTIIQKLRGEFHEWMDHHSRDYGSDDEKEKRFHIWKENHLRYVVSVDG